MEGPLRPAGLTLIETLRWDGARLVRLDRHLARLARSAAALGVPLDAGRVRATLAAVEGERPLRVRLAVGLDGEAALKVAPLEPTPARWRVAVAPDRLRSGDVWLRHKTSMRAVYDAARRDLPRGIDELVFANERGEVCEGTISTVFFDAGGGLRTPPVACGLLPGILREELIETGRCREEPLPLAALPGVRLWCGNSLRGLIPCGLAKAPGERDASGAR